MKIIPYPIFKFPVSSLIKIKISGKSSADLRPNLNHELIEKKTQHSLSHQI